MGEIVGAALEHSRDAVERDVLALRLGGMAVAAEVVRADSLPAEAVARARTVALLDSVTIREATETPPPLRHKESLHAMLHEAFDGDAEARAGVRANTGPLIGENLCKSGHVFRIEAAINDQGEVEQYGNTTTHRQRKTLEELRQSPAMRERAIVEGHSGYLFEALNADGSLKERKAFAEVSTVPDNVKLSELQNYFLETMTCIIRLTRVREDGVCEIVSALVSGVDQEALPKVDLADPANETARQKRALELRFDLAVVRKMYAALGVKGAENLGSTELLATALVLPDDFDSLEMVRLYDSIAAEHLGKEVFFGSTELRKRYGDRAVLTRKDYEEHQQASEALQKSFDPLVDAVTDEVINRHAEAQTPFEAIALLSKVSMDHIVDHLVGAKEVSETDMRPLGVEAMLAIQEARAAIARGDPEAAEVAVASAKKMARDTSCPPGAQRASESAPSGDSSTEDSEDGDGKKKEMNCPFCDAKVWADPCAKVLSCGDCMALAVNGKIVYEGNGGSRKRTAEAAQKAQARAEVAARAAAAEAKQLAALAVEAAFDEVGVTSFETEPQYTAAPANQVLVGVA
jgi:hypothetical protein